MNIGPGYDSPGSREGRRVILPDSNNSQYAGSKASAWFLIAYGCLEVIPGAIHYFLPDGGAGVIAGLNLAANRATIVGTFAWMGSLQIPFGIALIIIGWRYRPLVPLFLLLALIERTLMVLAAWVFRSSPANHHPPEHYGSVAAVLLIGVFLYLARPGAARSIGP